MAAQRKADRADDDGTYGLGGENDPAFSPVCTWCEMWKAGDGHHCAGAYPRGGPAIPMAIWSGANTHMGPYPNAEHPTDHGVHFELAKGASLGALKSANPKLYADYTAREQREGSSEGNVEGKTEGK